MRLNLKDRAELLEKALANLDERIVFEEALTDDLFIDLIAKKLEITTAEITKREKKLMAFFYPKDMVDEAIIKCFEICFDAFHKFLKEFLKEVYEVTVTNYPKPIFKAAYQAKLINEQAEEILIKMISHRNYTTHFYSKCITTELLTEIKIYCQTMNQIFIELKKKS